MPTEIAYLISFLIGSLLLMAAIIAAEDVSKATHRVLMTLGTLHLLPFLFMIWTAILFGGSR